MTDRIPKRERHEPRRPYQPPAIEDTAAFETLALACNKYPALGPLPDCSIHGSPSGS